MDSIKLSKIFRKASDILALYDNVPVDIVLDDIYRIIRAEKLTKTNEPTNDQESIVISDELINRMSTMNSEELTMFLQESEDFQSKKAILNLAKMLSITTSSRNNYSALSHSIVKYFERQRMDKLIREDRTSNFSTEN
ncbi:hypothetical protein GZH47_11855 [Paenibacillus rhizovicinus]|uniref:Uncharacterized protein n=1 Tax=Paenibacillus rhizovicinus TaxID=2704463 RepID=A0A6C0NZ19_9BACL|nr:hypothetical protein [Paenibacillus rhizovicinus]QHW31468.1 hypothetical protein GZH47_11855 [Paenibacillus rhizovicinus]